MLKRYFLILAILSMSLIAVPSAVYAVDVVPDNNEICNKNDATKTSTVCADNRYTESNPNDNPFFGPNGVLTKIINLLSVIVGIIAVITIILAGLKFVTSGSNPQDVTNARERIIYALVALVVAALAQVIVRYVIGNF